MAKFLKNIFLFILSGSILVSCSVQKRHYRPGYHTEQKTILPGGSVDQKKVGVNEPPSNNKLYYDTSAANAMPNTDSSVSVKCDTIFFMDGKKIVAVFSEATFDEVKYRDCNSDGPAYAVYKKDVYFIKRADGSPVSLEEKKDTSTKDPTGCDKIYFKDGKEISAHVIETNPEEIKYKECGDTNGITYSVYRKEVIMLRRTNGSYDVISSSMSEPEKEKEKYVPTKSKTTAFLLCLFLGFWGAHRYYLGYTGIGIVYTFTGGLYFIGWITDLFRIAVGDLKPKKGKYAKRKRG